MRLSRSLSIFGAVLFGFGSIVIAQDSTESPPAPESAEPSVVPTTSVLLELDVARQRLKNFLSDETALAPYKKADGGYRDLESTFTIGTPSGRFAVFWDPEACRFLGALDLKAPPQNAESTDSEGDGAPSPYTILAEGPHPFKGSSGAYGEPEFFGFRMINGSPAFLYTCGTLVIEERLSLDEEGEVLKQMFTIREPKNAISYTVPEAWKDRIDTTGGEWKGNVLTIPKENASEFLVSYRLAESDPAGSVPAESNPETDESN